MRKKIFQSTFFLLSLIVLLGGFFRFNGLGSTPAGLINDEADTGYDAYSILLTGYDQWNAFLPLVSFRGFGDYRPALYTYLVVGSEKLFGLTSFAVRFPSAFLGTFSIVLIFFLGKKLFSREVGLWGALLMAISPWAIGMSRVGIESNIAITFTLCGILCFLYAKKQPVLFLGALLAFLLAIYTYAAYTLFIPLAAVTVFLFWKKALPLSRKTILLSILLIMIFLLPFLVNRTTANTRISQVGFFHSLDTVGLTSVLNDQVGSCWQEFPRTLCKLILNKPIVFVSTFVKNYLSHFSPELLYLQGSATQFAILPMRGFEYLIEIIFALGGLVALIALRKRESFFLFFLLLLAAVPDAITGIGHYSRATVMLPFLLLLEASGVTYILSLWSSSLQKKIICILFAIILFFSITGFWVVYVTYFRQQYAMYSQYGYQSLIEKVDKEKYSYDTIYISRHLNDTKQYIYYLFYNAYDPRSFQKKSNILFTQGVDGWVSIDKIDNIIFAPTIPSQTQVLSEKNHILFISNPVDFPKTIASVFEIKDLQENVIFEAVDNKALQMYFKTHAQTENL